MSLPRPGWATLAFVEEFHVHSTIAECQGVKAHAAKALGIDRRTLYYKLAKYKKKESETEHGQK